MKKNQLKLMVLTLVVATAFSISSNGIIAKADVAPYAGTTINADLNATATPDHVTLTWSGDPTTTQTITWRANKVIATGVVQYIALSNSGELDKTVNATLTPFTTATGDTTVGSMNLFSVNLQNLTPGTKYLYRVGDGTNWNSIGTFTTEAANTSNFKFLIFGDSQSGAATNPNYAPWNTTVQNSFKANRDASFFVNMGDLVESGKNYIHWNNWYDAAKGVIDTIAEMPVQGNHETYNANSDTSAVPQYFKSQFNVPQNGPEGLKGQVYSYDYGNAHFVVLDSQEDEEAPGNNAFLQKQADWLEADLKASKGKFNFVFLHKTPYYNKATRTNPVVKSIFTPIIEKYHVDVVFNGHDHGISRTYPINNGTYFSSPTQGTVYYVTGRSGNKYYTDLNSKIWDANFYDPNTTPCYETVQINGNKLTINAFTNTGTKVDSFVIDKDNDANSTKVTLPEKFTDKRLIICGTSISWGSNQITTANGNTYINPNIIAAYYGGSYNATTYNLSAAGNYIFTAADVDAKGNINVTALTAKGFSVSTNSQFNAVMLDK